MARRKHYTRFTESQAIQARKLMTADRNPMTVAQVAEMFGVCPATVYKNAGCPRKLIDRRRLFKGKVRNPHKGIKKSPKCSGRPAQPTRARNRNRHRKSDSAA